MTATETIVAEPSPAVAPAWRRALVFGTGFGIAIGEHNLEAAVVRSRASGPTTLAAATIRDFRTRPAAEWGAELLKLLASANGERLAATVLLPRDEVIVRTVHLPGVPDKDIAGAIELQIDTLHPYGDEPVAWAWSRAGRDSVLAGVARKTAIDFYETLFTEAGIGMAAATFSSAVIHAALRIWSAAPACFTPLLCFFTDDNSRTEVYGQSEARAVYSAAFAVAPERAIAFSRAELRLAPDHPAQSLAEALPAASGPGAAPLAYAAALAGSAPLIAKFANLLPAERRASSSRMPLLVTSSVAGLLILAAIIVFAILPAMEQRRYLRDLNAELRRRAPAAERAQALERRIALDRNKSVALDEFRRRTQADLDVLNELTRLLPQQSWTVSIEIYPDSVTIAGEADQAAPLLKLLDSSPLFQNSEFALSVTHNDKAEQFRIKTMRRNRAGRTTP